MSSKQDLSSGDWRGARCGGDQAKQMEAGGKYTSSREGHRVGENIHLVQEKNTNPSSVLVWAEVLKKW